MLSISSAALANESIEQVFKKPLIIGASVSAGWGTLSPGDRLSRRFTDAKNILNVARGGRPGRDHMPLLKPSLVKDRSIILAMDFMFWDTTLDKPAASLAALDQLLELGQSRGIPVVLGDVPELLTGRQGLRPQINKYIHSKCVKDNGCYLLELDQLHKQVKRDQHLEIKGRKYRFPELVPDGLHLADVAGEYLADFILRVL
jgi:hypothetical protein